jgi:succinoglycan biosynthesis protein ExoL
VNILFILPVLSDSHYQKRIENFLREGIRCSVYGFERLHYAGKPWPVEIRSIGFIEHGKYIRRIWTLISSAKTIRKKIGKQDYIYTFNLDMLFLAWFSTLFLKDKPGFVYDLFDIHPMLYKKTMLSGILRAFERFLVRKTKVVVVASPYYIDGYFHELQNLSSVAYHVIENKLNAFDITHNEMNRNVLKKTADDPIVLGFFGIIRCPKSLEFLYHFLETGNGKFHLYIRGLFLVPEHVKKMILKSAFIEFGGSYLYPDELSEMYGKIDLLWAAQQLGEAHTKLSRTNRFYQGCYFKKPMITQAGTKDDEIAGGNNLGISIDLNKPEQSMELLSRIDDTKLTDWQINLKKVPENVFLITDEYKQLIQKLNKHD